MRLVPLRRPPVVRLAEMPFVPRCDLGEVERRWERLRDRNPAFYDGRLLHVLGVSRNGHGGATLHVVECAYRYWAAGLLSDHGDVPFDSGVRALGVKALVREGERVLVGRRGGSVAAYPDCLEFAPGGGVLPGRDPREMIEAELREETGIELEAGDRTTARALLYDDAVRSWEIVFEIRLRRPRPVAAAPGDAEYSSLEWIETSRLRRDRDDAPAMTPCAVTMRGLLDLGPGPGPGLGPGPVAVSGRPLGAAAPPASSRSGRWSTTDGATRSD